MIIFVGKINFSAAILKSVNCIVLSGGKSTRMGFDKATLSFGATSLLGYIVDNVKDFGFINEIYVSSSNEMHCINNTIRISDIYPNCGPLGAIYSGLMHSSCAINWVVSCDSPFVSSAVFYEMMNKFNNDDFDALIPIYNNKKYVTLGVYQKSCAVKFKEKLSLRHFKLQDALEGLNVTYINLDHLEARFFLNLNSLECYKKAQTLLDNITNHNN